jgi:hypothetical protein
MTTVDANIVDFIGERAVDDGDQEYNYLTAGMEAFDMSALGYPGMFGVHVGDPDEWLPVLYADGFISEDALVFELDFGDWNREHPEQPFYYIEDPHPMDKDEVGDSFIVFSSMSTIPAEIVRLVRAVPEAEIIEMSAELLEEEDEEWY